MGATAGGPSGRIRPISVAVVRRGQDLLVFRGEDGGVEFYRPLGGGIEFGETAEAALRREFIEELGVTLGATQLLGVLENRFVLAGVPGHEIVFVFAAELSGPVPDVVADTGEAISWEPAECFRDGTAILYPTGLGDLLTASHDG